MHVQAKTLVAVRDRVNESTSTLLYIKTYETTQSLCWHVSSQSNWKILLAERRIWLPFGMASIILVLQYDTTPRVLVHRVSTTWRQEHRISGLLFLIPTNKITVHVTKQDRKATVRAGIYRVLTCVLWKFLIPISSSWNKKCCTYKAYYSSLAISIVHTSNRLQATET